ncbi:MAG: M28 family metallopeptidase [Candidatus Hodarchaeota archaeon]
MNNSIKDTQLWKDISFLADERLNGRAYNTEGNRIAREYLLQRFEEIGLTPLFDDDTSYTQEIIVGEKSYGVNIGGYIPGWEYEYVLVGAHYDHLPGIPGADDNAASVGQMLHVAEKMVKIGKRTQKGVLFVSFDCEEPPNFLSNTMGSKFFVNHCPVSLDAIKVAIILDLTGHDVPIEGFENGLFITGAEFSSDLAQVVLQTDNQEPGIRIALARNDRIGDFSDHHAFRINGRPFLFLSCGWWEHYHHSTDRLEVLNPSKVQHIATYLKHLVNNFMDREILVDMCNNEFLKLEANCISSVLQKKVPAKEKVVSKIINEIKRKLQSA